MLDESLAISSELGMRPLMERVPDLQGQAETKSSREPSYPDGLTKREVEVLQQVAAGKMEKRLRHVLQHAPF